MNKQDTTLRHGTPPSRRRDVAAEVRLVREEAVQRYGETDLLVAALRDHIRDLQSERDRLRAELDSMRQASSLASADWFWRGTRGPRDD